MRIDFNNLKTTLSFLLEDAIAERQLAELVHFSRAVIELYGFSSEGYTFAFKIF